MRVPARSVARIAVALLAVFPCASAVSAQAPPAGQPAAAKSTLIATKPRPTVGSQGPLPQHAKFDAQQIQAGSALFASNCAFCHGRDAGGGETGPDLTRSKVVAGDQDGESIGNVVRNGRPDKGMPRFSLPSGDILDIVAFLHSQQDKMLSQSGNRKGVEDSDLATGNSDAGKRYFDGAGGCTKCHSVSGDLAGVGSRYSGLLLLENMLYPRNVVAKVVVTTASQERYEGTLQYQDEFHIGISDANGTYHSWPVSAVSVRVMNSPDQHVEIMKQYTDQQMHDVLAYLKTLR